MRDVGEASRPARLRTWLRTGLAPSPNPGASRHPQHDPFQPLNADGRPDDGADTNGDKTTLLCAHIRLPSWQAIVD